MAPVAWRGVSVNRYRDPLTLLIAQGRPRGFITFQQANAYLPDEGGSPRTVDDLVLALEQGGLDFIDDPDQSRAALATLPAEKSVNVQKAQETERVELLKQPASSALS